MIDPDKLNLLSTISKARKMYLEDVTTNKISMLLGVSSLRVKRWVADLEPEAGGWEVAIDNLLAKGYSQTELARILCKRIGCKLVTARPWFGKHNKPPNSVQRAIIALDQELELIDWRGAVDNLLTKGYSKKELAQILCEQVGCKLVTAQRWFNKRQRPSLSAQLAIITLDQELDAMPVIGWKAAVDSLLSKGYSQIDLARILCKKIGCKVNTAKEWFRKRNKPPVSAQQAIVAIDEELEAKYDTSWDGNWEASVDSLLVKGYSQMDLAQILCKRIDCKPYTARLWFTKHSKPPISSQQAIVALDQELEPIDWRGAVDRLLSKGYAKKELAQILCKQIGCNVRTAQYWFTKRRRPPLPARLAIVAFDQELDAMPVIGWKAAVDSLLSKGYSKIGLARILCEKIGCKVGAAQGWFGKRNKPPVSAQQAIVALDRELPSKSKNLLRRRNRSRSLRRRNPVDPDKLDTLTKISKARKMRLEGAGIRDISRTLQVPYSTMRRWVKKMSFDWEGAVDSLLEKGFNKKELANMLCERMGCKFGAAAQWISKKNLPPLSAQAAMIELDQEITAAPKWQEAVDSLINKGYLKGELAHMLCKRIGCNPKSAKFWFAKKNKPLLSVRAAIVELDKDLPALPLWEDAMRSMLDKDYGIKELSRMLTEVIDYRSRTIQEWFSKKKRPPISAQYAIVNLDQELPVWKNSIPSLLKKGYKQYEIIRMLCERIGCNTGTAKSWFTKGRPSLSARIALAKLDQELPDRKLPERMEIEDAIDRLMSRGYRPTELARMLCERIDCTIDAVYPWLIKKHMPPIAAQHAIVELDQQLPDIMLPEGIEVEDAIDSLMSKGYRTTELARMLCKRVDCNPGSALHWFYKSRSPSKLTIQRAIVELDQELPGMTLPEGIEVGDAIDKLDQELPPKQSKRSLRRKHDKAVSEILSLRKKKRVSRKRLAKLADVSEREVEEVEGGLSNDESLVELLLDILNYDVPSSKRRLK